jgi:hypothetical protein
MPSQAIIEAGYFLPEQAGSDLFAAQQQIDGFHAHHDFLVLV